MTSFAAVNNQRGSRSGPPREYMTAIRTVTVAELLALDASPVELVPAPGEGKVAVPLSIIARGQGGTPYNQGNGNLAVRYRSAAEPTILIDNFALRTEPFLLIAAAGNSGIVSLVENDGIVLATDAPGSGELTDGDYEMEIRLEYQIVEL